MEDPKLLPLLLTVIGTVLVVMEAFLPGAYLIVFGVSVLGAGIVGLVTSFTGPLAMGFTAVIIAIISFFSYRRLAQLSGESSKTLASDSLVGEVGEVTTTVGKHDGEVKLEVGFDPNYSARSFDGTEIPEGTQVIVMDPGGGNLVKVMPLDQLETVDSASEVEKRRREVVEEIQRKRAKKGT